MLALNQKSNMQELDDEQIIKIIKKNDEVEAKLSAQTNKIAALQAANAKLQYENELLNFKIETRNIEIEALKDSRDLLKNDNDVMNEKVLTLQLKLYESKLETVDLLS